MRLANKIALVTGAARGIGQAIAEEFAQQGATVIVTDVDKQAGQQVASDIGDSAHFLSLDVGLESAWSAISDRVRDDFGRLDILVNNAGITGFMSHPGPFDPEHFNLDGVALGCKYAIGLMKHSPAASIVNISSRSGMVGIPAAAAYASSKAAVRNHTKSVALYCAEKGYPIRCNSIHPGAILTPIWEAMLGDGEARQQAIAAIAADIPLQHMGTPQDVAFAALYLASDESNYVTGTELTIDGGILAGSAARPPTSNEE